MNLNISSLREARSDSKQSMLYFYRLPRLAKGKSRNDKSKMFHMKLFENFRQI